MVGKYCPGQTYRTPSPQNTRVSQHPREVRVRESKKGGRDRGRSRNGGGGRRRKKNFFSPPLSATYNELVPRGGQFSSFPFFFHHYGAKGVSHYSLPPSLPPSLSLSLSYHSAFLGVGRDRRHTWAPLFCWRNRKIIFAPRDWAVGK